MGWGSAWEAGSAGVALAEGRLVSSRLRAKRPRRLGNEVGTYLGPMWRSIYRSRCPWRAQAFGSSCTPGVPQAHAPGFFISGGLSHSPGFTGLRAGSRTPGRGQAAEGWGGGEGGRKGQCPHCLAGPCVPVEGEGPMNLAQLSNPEIEEGKRCGWLPVIYSPFSPQYLFLSASTRQTPCTRARTQ